MLMIWSAICKIIPWVDVNSYMSYVDTHSCVIRKCLRYAQINLQYGQLHICHMLTFINVMCNIYV